MSVKNKSVEIREAGASDAPQIAALARIIWTEHFTPIIGAAQVEYMLDKFQSENAVKGQLERGMKYIIACSGGALVGYSCYRLEEEALFLSKLYVRSDCRGFGTGKKMFMHELEIARNEGKKKIYLTVNKHNDSTIAIYEHMGFVKAKSAVTDIGGGFVMDDYIMEYAVK